MDQPATDTHPVETSKRPPRRFGVRRPTWRGFARGVALLLFLAAASASVTPAGRTIYRSALLLPSLLTTSQTPFLTLSGGEISHVTRTLDTASGPVYLDIFAPQDNPAAVPHARAGVLVIAGVGDNRGDISLINLETSLARSGVVVMTMTTQALINWQLTPSDVDGVVRATDALKAWPGVAADRVGLVGISAGGALMCLAAADSRLAGRLAYVTLFGSFYDGLSFLRDVGRRALDTGGHPQPWQPQDVPLYVLATSLAPTFSPADAGLILAVFGVNGSAFGAERTLLTADQVATLTPGGQAFYHLLAGDQPDQVATNLAALPTATRDGLTLLSPKSIVARLRTQIYLLHDTSDQYVPFTESRDFAAA
ncbi:MAG TPA: hypothetical protein VF807_12790, partial [Ktedonobacterales bacterium]